MLFSVLVLHIYVLQRTVEVNTNGFRAEYGPDTFEERKAAARAAMTGLRPRRALELWLSLAHEAGWSEHAMPAGVAALPRAKTQLQNFVDALKGVAEALREVKQYEREEGALRMLLIAQGQLGALPETFLLTFTQLIMALNRNHRHDQALNTVQEARRAIGASLTTEGIAMLDQLHAYCQECKGEHEPALETMIRISPEAKGGVSSGWQWQIEAMREIDGRGRLPRVLIAPAQLQRQLRSLTLLLRHCSALKRRYRACHKNASGATLTSPVLSSCQKVHQKPLRRCRKRARALKRNMLRLGEAWEHYGQLPVRYTPGLFARPWHWCGGPDTGHDHLVERALPRAGAPRIDVVARRLLQVIHAALSRVSKSSQAMRNTGANIQNKNSRDNRSSYTVAPHEMLLHEYTALKQRNLLASDSDCIAAPLNITTPDAKPTAAWRRFESTGAWNELDKDGCASSVVPISCAVLDALRAARIVPIARVGFSAVSPGAWIRPHFGSSNSQLKLHYGLRVPSSPTGEAEPCTRMRVANVTRTWIEGGALTFDDSFEHEVWNDCSDERVVLQVVFRHPDIPAADRDFERKPIVLDAH